MRISVNTTTGKESIVLTVAERNHIGRASFVLRSLSHYDKHAAAALEAVQKVAAKIGAEGVYDAWEET